MTKIDDELRINAANLRQRAKRVEKAWEHVKRISAKASAETRASRRAERRAALEMERHRDRQAGKFGPASPVRRVKPE
jgi:hypothetical protein